MDAQKGASLQLNLSLRAQVFLRVQSTTFYPDSNKGKFDWDQYLESRNLMPAPNFAFQHVDKSQESLLNVGTLVEVQTSPLPRFWLATVTLKCGPFLRLKHFGQEDSTKEIWTDPASVEVRPVGYSSSRGWALEPPGELKHQMKVLWPKMASLVEQHRAVDCEASLLSPAQQLKVGTTIEVEDANRPLIVWPAEIKRNVGGRLLIQYSLPKSVALDTVPPECTEWIFCLSLRLHWKGWAYSMNQARWSFEPPLKIRHLSDQWSAVADSYRIASADGKPWQMDGGAMSPQARHSFSVGERIPSIDSLNPTAVRTATVVQLIDEQRYVIRLESNQPDVKEEEGKMLVCFANQHISTLEETDGSGFEPNMALEVVNPFQPAEICVGVITAIERLDASDGEDIRDEIPTVRLLRIRTEMKTDAPAIEFLVATNSHDLFPVGWCDSQGYPLTAPSLEHTASSESLQNIGDNDANETNDRAPTVDPKEGEAPEESVTAGGGSSGGVSYWCPKIYFNFRCFSGPLLSRIRVAALPRSVGPGPIGLVMKEVLAQVLNGAYKPGSVLKQLQGEPDKPELPPGTQLEPMKAKYRQTTYRGSVPVACTAADVPAYCRWVCEKLQCCPYLFGPELVGDPCPHRCCILAKAVWQHKKKAPNWRHRRFIDILKSSEGLVIDDSLINVESIAGKAGAVAPVVESAEPSEDESAQSAQHSDADEPPAKKKRGRPRKNMSVASAQSPAKKLHSEQGGRGERDEPDLRPELWSSKQVWRFLQSTDCRPLADRLFQQEVDGPSLMLLRPADIADYVTLNWTLALRLCRLVDSLRIIYSRRLSRIAATTNNSNTMTSTTSGHRRSRRLELIV